MTVLISVLIFFALLIVAVMQQILIDDIKSFAPRLAQKMLRRAALRINELDRHEYYEIWMADLADTPETIGKLWNALTIYIWGARKLARNLNGEHCTAALYPKIKRGVDLILVLYCAPAFIFLALPMALLVMLDGGKPFVACPRVGKGGQVYKCWKIRTMVPGADEVLEEYLRSNPSVEGEFLVTQKLAHDPRISWFGRFLRKTSLDEVPQLWNVLVGDMSLVGPRPLTPAQRKHYPGLDYDRHRPGITGNWQVTNRGKSGMVDRARVDSEYVKGMSFKQDMKVLLETFMVVIRGTGK